MNREAEAHLERAEKHLVSGEVAYRKAASEIQAALDVDPRMTTAQIGQRLGRSGTWVRELLTWANSGSGAPTPYSGAEYAGKQAASHARRLLREAPIEEVERIVAELPPERRGAIQRAITETHPAHQTKPSLGVGENVRRMEANTSFVTLMSGTIELLDSAVGRVQESWEHHSPNATDEEKEIVQEQIRDAVASLLAINSDPQELLR